VYQQIYLLAMFETSGAAVLPVGVVVRDPATGAWRKSMLAVPGAQHWQEILAGYGEALSDEVVEYWEERGNGITWDVRITEIEAGDLERALVVAGAAVMADYVAIGEEA
jgi:hypothetical protein